jgi:hypothetical protein
MFHYSVSFNSIEGYIPTASIIATIVLSFASFLPERISLIYDLLNVSVLPDGSMKKGDRNDPKQQADSLDCFRYYLNQFHKDFIKMPSYD